jgi:O-antigen/teichoic acid export membrane protein
MANCAPPLNPSATPDLARQARQSVGWTLLQNVGRNGGNFLVFLLLAKLLSPQAFGLIAMAGVMVMLVNVLIEQGLGDALLQHPALEPAHLDTAFWLTLSLSIVATLLVLLTAPWLARLYGQPELGGVLQALAPLFILTGLSTVQQASLQRKFAFRTLALRSVVAVLAGGVVSLGLASAGLGIWSLVGQQLSAGLAGSVVLWCASSWRPRRLFSAAHAKDLWQFSRHILGANLLNFVSRKSDDLLIGLYLGPVALGFYAVAYQILTALEQLLSQGLDAVALSSFSRLQDQMAALRQAFLTAVQLAALAVFPAFAGVALVAPEFVMGVLGPQWQPSVAVLQWLAFAGMLHGIFHFNHAIFKACGHPALSLRLMLLSTVANLLLFLLFVRSGIEAVAMAYVLRAYLLAPLGLLVLRRVTAIRLRDYLQPLLWPLLATLAMAGLLLALKPWLQAWPPLPGLALLVLAGAAMYLLVIRVFSAPLWHRVMKYIVK